MQSEQKPSVSHEVVSLQPADSAGWRFVYCWRYDGRHEYAVRPLLGWALVRTTYSRPGADDEADIRISPAFVDEGLPMVLEEFRENNDIPSNDYWILAPGEPVPSKAGVPERVVAS